MQSENYIVFEISGVKQTGHKDSMVFSEDAICEISNDQFIRRVVVAAEISIAIFYLHDSLRITDEIALQIVNYLYEYLGSMMISLIKNCSRYPTVPLMPKIRLSSSFFVGSGEIANMIKVRDNIGLSDSASMKIILDDGNNILDKWIQDVDVQRYSNKQSRYSILLSLLKEPDETQKYMALYAYLMSLVREIYSEQKELQKHVVKYVTDNCSRVGISLNLSPSTRPSAKPNDEYDQFTALRNKIGHPAVQNGFVDISENAVNGIASIVCCAIEDVSF